MSVSDGAGPAPGSVAAASRGSAAVRGLALFLGAFGAANAGGGLVAPGFDANRIWIGDSTLPPLAATALVGGGGLVLTAWAVWGGSRRRLAKVASFVAGALACVAVADAFVVLRVHVSGAADVFPLPLSAAVALGLAWIARAASVARRAAVAGQEIASPSSSPDVAVWAGAWALVLPLALMVALGGTVYRRPADAIVVLGARAYADGRPSVALADRVRTACRAWRDGLAPRLLLSGGPGDGDVHETEAMRRLAISEGVPPSAIVLDPRGVDSRSTVRNALRDAGPAPRLVVVSHAWHLPRLDLAFERRGAVAYTVPAEESRWIARTPWFIAREVAAFWAEWAFGGAGG